MATCQKSKYRLSDEQAKGYLLALNECALFITKATASGWDAKKFGEVWASWIDAKVREVNGQDQMQDDPKAYSCLLEMQGIKGLEPHPLAPRVVEFDHSVPDAAPEGRGSGAGPLDGEQEGK